MDPIQKLASLFAEFPGIGTRQSKRFVYFLLKKNRAYRKELITLIESLEGTVFSCSRCFRFSAKRYETAGSLCGICSDTNRDRSMLMVVEKDSDFEAIEKSGTFRGTYFVLGGTLPILEKEPTARIKILPLRELVKEESMNLKEIILACAVTPESEHTAEYVRTMIEPIAQEHLIAITTLGRGLSTGTELEYSDAETLRFALEGRR
jgi:recombination protein RecR